MSATITLNIPQAALSPMRKYWEDEKAAGIAMMKEGQNKVATADGMLSQLGGSPQLPFDKPANDPSYKSSLSWAAKAKFILRRERKEMTVNEIINEIGKLEHLADRRKAYSNVYSDISTNVKKPAHYYAIVIEGEEMKYGLLEWKK